MASNRIIESFDITAGEKVTYGYYAALEVVFKQFVNDLESLFFDMFNLSLDFDFEIKSGTKFRRYLDSIDQPAPFFIFNLSPYVGDCLLKIDNITANLILSSRQPSVNQAPIVDNRFRITPTNHATLKVVIEKILRDFYACWGFFFKAEGKLKKLVSNKIRAKILKPVEACVIVAIKMRQSDFEANWEFCFSAYQMDQVIKQFGAKVLLASNNEVRENNQIKEKLTNFLLTASTYDVRGILGELVLSQKELNEKMKTDTVIPIINEIEDNVIVFLNDQPMLSGSLGVTNDSLALQINGKYEQKRSEIKTKQKPFKKLTFPLR